jgi:hypothetical protein
MEFVENFLIALGVLFSIALLGGCIVLGIFIGESNPRGLFWYVPLACIVLSGWIGFFAYLID